MVTNRMYFSILFLFGFIFSLKAQQANNWLFPLYNGITFNTNPPTLISNTYFDTESFYSCASISDNNGNLLFSTDGYRVWDKNGLVMPNGFGLFGRTGNVNTALIIPFIGDSLKYHLFVSQGSIGGASDQDTCKYSYNIVDMSLNNGLGDLTTKNQIIRYKAIEKMVAIPNANGNDIWWICRDWTNHFYSYKITCTGFQNINPIISTVGLNINNDTDLLNYGDIKASPNGNFIAAAHKNYFEIYKFNSITGIVSNSILIPIINSFDSYYGVEFSPDNKFLYTTGIEYINGVGSSFIRQYNLTIYDATSIINSSYTVNNLYGGGGLQLGPDNKIYNNDGGEAVDVINNPNVQGVGCNFQDSVIALLNGGYRRFPYSFVNLITAQNVQITYTVATDCRTVTFTGKTFIKGNNLTFKWKWGEPPPVGGTIADSATQVVASQGDTTLTTITHVYPLGQDTFFVNLSVTSDTVCGTGRAGIKVIVKPPKPTANFGFATTCNNLNVAFTDTSLLNTNPSITHQYAVKPALAAATAFTNYSTTPSHTYTFPSYDSFDIRLIVTSPLACVAKDTIIKRVVLKAKPTAGFTYTNACGSVQANITSAANITAGSITTQEYYVGNTLIGTGVSPTYSFASYGSYTVKHLTKSNVGCISDTAFVPVVVKAKPLLTFSPIPDSVCLGSSYTITANATIAASTITNYTWLRNGVVLPNTTNQLTENQPTGTYTYKVIATAANTCKSDTATKIITVVSKPASTLTATNVCGSKAINILSSANVINDNITSYYLNYGDNNTSTTNPNNTTYTYTNYGSYNLKFVAKSSIGCASDTFYQTINVKDKPVLTFSPIRDSVCLGSSFTITANASVNASSITNYTWLRNGTLLANSSNQLTDNQPTGTYTYKVVATAANTCKSDTATKIITVVSKPTIIPTVTNSCGSKQINILSSTSVVNDNITSYYVNYGDNNTSTTNPNNTTYTYANYGSYNLKFVAKSSIGCLSDTVFKTIVVKDKPTLSITYNNNACDTTNFTLSATANVVASTISNYTWLRNNIVLPNTTNQLTDNQLTNTYTYKLVATALTGCKSDTATQIVTVQKYPKTIFTATNGCVNKNIVLTNSSINNNTNSTLQYSWITSNGLTNNGILPTFTFATSGTKTIQLKTSSSNGCADSLQKTITIEDFPVADFSITEACLGKPITIANNSNGVITNYNWTTNNGQISNSILPNFIFNTEGNYTIKLQVATANNCTNDIAKSTSIQAVQLFTTPAKDTNAVVGQPIVLSVTGADTYAWSPMNNLQLTFSDGSKGFVASAAGAYPIQIEGTTAKGCKGTTSIKINVFVASNYVWIPNAFTPNADGLNDRVKITCSGLQTLTNFIIYNRYGETLYTQNSCNAKGWDGTYKGKEQPIGAYVYVWTGVDFKRKAVSGKGTVMLVR